MYTIMDMLTGLTWQTDDVAEDLELLDAGMHPNSEMQAAYDYGNGQHFEYELNHAELTQ